MQYDYITFFLINNAYQTHIGMSFSPYMAPEYLYRGEISTQSDIYSLGLMIIEITVLEKNRPETRDLSARSYIEKVMQC